MYLQLRQRVGNENFDSSRIRIEVHELAAHTLLKFIQKSVTGKKRLGTCIYSIIVVFCGLPGSQERRKLFMPGDGVQNGFSHTWG